MENKSKVVYKEIIVPLYQQKVLFVIAQEVFYVNKKLGINFNSNDEVFASTYYNFNYKETNTSLILLNFNNDTASITHGIIAHECCHLVEAIFERVGAKHNIDNPESFTYLLEYLVDELYKFLKEQKMLDKIMLSKRYNGQKRTVK